MSYYIHSYIKQIFSGWIKDSFSQDSVKIGLLNGHLALANLELEEKDWINLSDGLGFSVEKGSIGKLEIHAPWHLLHQGYASMSLVDLNVFLQLKFAESHDGSKPYMPSVSHDAKMSKVQEKEMLLLGLKQSDSLFSSYAKRWLMAFLGRLASSFTLSVKKVRLTILVPLPGEEESLLLEINIDSITVGQMREKANLDESSWTSVLFRKSALISKEIVMKNASLHLGIVPRLSKPIDLQTLWEKPAYSYPMILSVYNTILSIKLSRTGGELSWLAEALSHGLDENDLLVSLECLNVDFTCAIHQILRMRDCVEFITLERRRLKLQAVRRLLFSDDSRSSDSFNAKQHWKYVLKAVTFVAREEKKTMKGRSLRSAVANLSLRRSYITIYRKKIEYLLSNATLMDKSSASVLSSEESRRLRELEGLLPVSDLALFRTVVYKDIVSRFNLATSILMIIIQGKPIPKDWQQRKEKSSIDTNFVLASPNEESLARKQLLKLSVTIVRVGAVIYHNDSLSFASTTIGKSPTGSNTAKSTFTGSTNNSRTRNVLTFVVAGLAIDWDNAANLMDAYLGRLSVYGVDGSMLLRFGSMADANTIGDFRLQCFQGNPNLALSFNFQYLDNQPNSASDTNEKTFKSLERFSAVDIYGNVNHYFFRPSRDHLVAETKLSNLIVVWNQNCISYLLHAVNLLHPPEDISSSNPFADEKLRLANLSIYNSSNGIVAEKRKMSLSIVLKGIKVVFPIHELSSDSATVSASGKSRDCLELGFEDLQFSSGDYLNLSLSNLGLNPSNGEGLSSESDKQRQPEDDENKPLLKMFQTILALRNPLVQPVIFALRGFFVRYNNVRDNWEECDNNERLYSPTVNILRVPWSADGAVSICSLYSHPEFTDRRIDLHLGPLEMQLQSKDVVRILEILTTLMPVGLQRDEGSLGLFSLGKYLIAPKIARLEGLSKALFAVHLDRIKFICLEEDHREVPEKNNAVQTVLDHILRSEEYNQQIDFDDHVVTAFRRLLVDQLVNFGFLRDQAFAIAKQCIDCQSRPLSPQETLGQRIVSLLRPLLEKSDMGSFLLKNNVLKVQFQVEMTHIDIVSHQMMYGQDIVVKMERMVFFDSNHVTLFALRNQDRSIPNISNSAKEIIKDSLDYKKASKVRTPDVSSEESVSSSSLSILFHNAQENEGVSVTELYLCHYKDREERWTSDLSIECANVDLYFSTTRVVSITNYVIDLTADIMTQLQQRQEERRRADRLFQDDRMLMKDSSLPSPTSLGHIKSRRGSEYQNHTEYNFRASVDLFSVLLACNSNLFSALDISGVNYRYLSKSAVSKTLISIAALQLIDLTSAGQLYRTVLWKKSSESKQSDNLASLEVYEENNTIKIIPHVIGLRVVFLMRFITELIAVINNHIIAPIARVADHAVQVSQFLKDSNTDSVKETNPFEDFTTEVTFLVTEDPLTADSAESGASSLHASNRASNNSGSGESGSAVELICSLDDLQVVVPRNSFSRDLIGFVVESASVIVCGSSKSWDVPTKDVVEQIVVTKTPWECPLYFDPILSQWTEGGNVVKSSIAPSRDEDDGVQYFDAFDTFVDTSKVDSAVKDITRIAIELDSTALFISLGSSLEVPFPKDSLKTKEDNNDVSITWPAPQLSEIVDAKETSIAPDSKVRESRTWQCISRSKLNLQVIVDLTPTKTRLLFGDTARSSKLDVALSQAELYLLMCLWFDNVHELPRFLTDDVTSVDAATSGGNNEGNSSLPSVPFSEYGSIAYLQHYLHRPSSFELAVVRAEVCCACAADIHYFPINNPNHIYLQSIVDMDRCVLAAVHESFRTLFTQSNPDIRPSKDGRRSSMRLSGANQRKVAPLADFRVTGFILYSCCDDDVLQMSIGASLVEVYDVRQPLQTPIPLLLRLAPLEDPSNQYHLKQDRVSSSQSKRGLYSYGYVDVLYAFGNTGEDTDMTLDRSLKFSMLLCTTSNWITMNLGLDLPDLNLNCLDIFLLLSDYFSCFFRFADFGHPSLAAFNRLNKMDIPYGGTDFRLFIMRPHISVLENYYNAICPGFFIECERGLFYRYVLDTDGSNRTEVNLHDMAMVLVKQYRPPVLSRGMRGSSGSGRGVRTMIEYLNATFVNSFSFKDNQVDMELEIFVPDEEDEPISAEKREFVDLNSTFGSIDPPFVIEPTCLSSFSTSKKDFPSLSSYVVTSYEDVLFCWKVWNQLISKDKYVADSSSTTHDVSSASVSNYLSVSVSGIRLMIVDNVLGLHLPLFQSYCDSLRFVIDNQANERLASIAALQMKTPEDRPTSVNKKHSFWFSPSFADVNKDADAARDQLIYDEHWFGTTTFWIEYFNSLKKCWEPCVEKLSVAVQYEKSQSHGSGFVVKSTNAVQCYFSGALIRSICDLLRTFHLDHNSHISELSSQLQDQSEVALDLFDDFSIDQRNNSFDERLVSFRSVEEDPAPSGLQNKSLNLKTLAGPKMNRRRGSIMFGPANLLTTGASDKIDHIPSNPLPSSFRVGFSIINLTGQPMRYLHQLVGDKKVVQYLNNNERGLLNINATQTLIRNGRIVEDKFEVQQEHMASLRTRSQKKLVGNRVALQIAGYRWLHSVQVDELGTHFEELAPILGRVDATEVFKEKSIAYALKLMVEVLPHCGGRMLKLRSVFCIKNCTKHKLQILAKLGVRSVRDGEELFSPSPLVETGGDPPFYLNAEEEFYIPIALLYQSIINSQGHSLGLLFIKPADLQPMEEELESRLGVRPGHIEYSTDPINLLQLTSKPNERIDGSVVDFSEWFGEGINSRSMQLCCHVNPKQHIRHGRRGLNPKNSARFEESEPSTVVSSSSASKLPQFCYCVEVIRNGETSKKVRQVLPAEILSNPESFTIAIHPPILIENLLPTAGVFELLHAENKQVLWSSCISAGAVKAIHTVTLEDPLILVINLRYCRASEGVVIHRPKPSASQRGLVSRLQKAIEGLLEEGEQDDVSSIVLTDTVGQRIRLNVDNTQGTGGQRHVIIYCPYWIINTSQYSFRLREEGDMELPAGTVTPQRDGTRPVPSSSSIFQDKPPTFETFDPNRLFNAYRGGNGEAGTAQSSAGKIGRLKHWDSSVLSNNQENMPKTPVFPGCCGVLHQFINKEIALNSPLCDLMRPLDMSEMMELSYMFNYRDNTSVLSNHKKVKFQLDDTDWSRSFSLESAGVNQTLSMDHPTRGLLEVGMKISVAPGRLSKYTKIVRFQPRYVVVNRLDCQLKVLQASGIAGEMTEVEVSSNHVRPYHLPALYGEHAISLQAEGPWKKTVFFKIDQIGAFTLEAKRYIDLATIPHVNTRGAPEYTEYIPPSRTVGIFFETDWGEENIVVKAIQNGSYASHDTDIRVGDVLLAIDDEPVDGSKFELSMIILKSKISDKGCNIKLRTVEEKMRLIRETALQSAQRASSERRKGQALYQNRAVSTPLAKDVDSISVSREMTSSRLTSDDHRETLSLRVELKLAESTIMVLVNELNDRLSTEYRIENRSVCYCIHYKQKGIPGSSWKTLNPGQSCAYVWQDPFKPHKLLMHVGQNLLCPGDTRNSATSAEGGELGDRGRGDDSLGKYLGYLAGMSNENATVISMDEIGFKEFLPLRGMDAKLTATIKSEGPTKVLLIAPSLEKTQLLKEMRYCTSFLQEQVAIYSDIEENIAHLLELDTSQIGQNVRMGSFRTQISNVLANSLVQLREAQQRVVALTTMNEVFSAGEDGHYSLAISAGLASHRSFERIFEGGIDHQHQLIVEVLEACDLPPLVRGKHEDIYCKLYIRNDEESMMDKAKRQSFVTYVCDQTTDPEWLHQKFVFTVDPESESRYRRYNLRILVKAKSVAGVDNVLAKLDVPFSCLRNEEVVEGWFPLRPSRSSLLLHKASGSIRLRLQWIHSDSGFTSYVLQQTERRLKAVKLQYDVQKHQLKAIERLLNSKFALKNNIFENELSEYEQKDYYEMVAKVANMQPVSRTTRARTRFSIDSCSTPRRRTLSTSAASNNQETNSEFVKNPASSVRNSILASLAEEKKEDWENESDYHTPSIFGTPLRFKEEKTTMSQLKGGLTVRHCYDRIMRWWLNTTRPYRPLHDRMTVFMSRSKRLQAGCERFRSQFKKECARNYAHAFSLTGALEIIPVAGSHLPTDCSVHVRISYGNERFVSTSVPAGSFSSWYQDTAIEGETEEIKLSPSISKTFPIDLLNVKGDIQVRVMEETFSKSREIAKVELGIFNIVDCTCILGSGNFYDRWFPLSVAERRVSPGSNGLDWPSQNRECEHVSDSKFGYRPCIRLKIRWIPTYAVSRIEDPQFYGRFSIPSIFFSLVDSEHARTVMLAALRDVEIRQAVTKSHTDISLNIASFQVDNQLPEPVANVILSPKMVKAPQPIVRLHLRRKNLLSQKNLECYQTIQLVVQELDLRLEQQTVLASWALLKNWLHEAKAASSVFYFLTRSKSKVKADAYSAPSSLGQSSHQSSPIPQTSSAGVSTSPMVPALRPPPLMTSDSGSSLYYDDDKVKLYIEDFRIFPIKINVSFLITPPHIVHVYRKQLKKLDIQAEGSGSASSSVSLFLWQVGEVVLDLTSSISNAPIFFNGFEAPHLFKTSADVSRILQEHYLHSALGQLYKIVGSLEVVGNPIALLSSLSVGVHDFFYEPAHALITSPTAFGKIGKGVFKGTLSLVSNTTAGFLGTGTTITRTLTRGFAKLSLDNSYIRAREKLQKTPGTVMGVLSRPAKDVAVGVVYSVTGLIKAPYTSVKINGVQGALPGMIKGLAGLVVDPCVGILDAVTHSGDACKEILKAANRTKMEEVQRLRLSDLFGPDGRLLPYEAQVALGTEILRALARSNKLHASTTAASNSSDSYSRNVSLLGLQQQPSIHTQELLGRTAETPPRPALVRGDSSKSDENPVLPFPPSASSYLSPPPPVKRPSMILRRNRFSFSANAGPVSGGGTGGGVMFGSERPHSLNADKEVVRSGSSSNENQDAELVIYTFVLNHEPSRDLVVILTIHRLVVVDAIISTSSSSTTGFSVSKRWEIAYSHLAAPVLERGNTDLILRTHSQGPLLAESRPKSSFGFLFSTSGPVSTGASTFSSQSSPSPASPEISSLVLHSTDSATLVNLFNCLHAILGTGVTLLSADGGLCAEDDAGVRHIGPWQFIPQRPGSDRKEEDDQIPRERLMKELEMEKWFFSADDQAERSNRTSKASSSATTNSNSSNSSTKPAWLQAEEQQAIRSHAEVLALYNRCRALENELSQSSSGAGSTTRRHRRDPRKHQMRTLIQALFKGKITKEEFEQELIKSSELMGDSTVGQGKEGEREEDEGKSLSEGGPKTWKDYLGLNRDAQNTSNRLFSLFSDLTLKSEEELNTSIRKGALAASSSPSSASLPSPSSSTIIPTGSRKEGQDLPLMDRFRIPSMGLSALFPAVPGWQDVEQRSPFSSTPISIPSVPPSMFSSKTPPLPPPSNTTTNVPHMHTFDEFNDGVAAVDPFSPSDPLQHQEQARDLQEEKGEQLAVPEVGIDFTYSDLKPRHHRRRKTASAVNEHTINQEISVGEEKEDSIGMWKEQPEVEMEEMKKECKSSIDDEGDEEVPIWDLSLSSDAPHDQQVGADPDWASSVLLSRTTSADSVRVFGANPLFRRRSNPSPSHKKEDCHLPSLKDDTVADLSRRWSSPAVLPRLITPPRHQITPKKSATDDAISSSHTVDAGGSMEAILGRLERLESLLVHALQPSHDHLSTPTISPTENGEQLTGSEDATEKRTVEDVEEDHGNNYDEAQTASPHGDDGGESEPLDQQP